MNKILLILCLALLTSCSPKEVDKDGNKDVELQKEDIKIDPMQQVISFKDENLKKLRRQVEREGSTIFTTVGVGESLLLAYCDAMDEIVRIYPQAHVNDDVVNRLLASRPLSPNLEVFSMKEVERIIARADGSAPEQMYPISGRTRINLSGYKVNCEYSDGTAKASSDLKSYSDLKTEMEKEGHEIKVLRRVQDENEPSAEAFAMFVSVKIKKT